MAHSPLIIKEPKDYITNPRQDLLEETKNQIIGRKGIVLRGYMTEKQRIEQHLRELETSKFINILH